MILRNKLLHTGLIVACLILAGCAGNYSALNKNWGYAYETARHDQIMNLNAGKNSAPVTGLDGQIAYKSYTLYRNGFTKASSSAGSDTSLSMSGAGK
jgi:hypothetical protein